MKNILFVASECVPFIKTGGLADVVGALPKALDREQFDVRVIIPNYMAIPERYRNDFEYVSHFYMDLGGLGSVYVGILTYQLDGVTYYFIDNQYYFGGPKPYGDIHWDIEKFCFFSKAALSCRPLGSIPTSSTATTGRPASCPSSCTPSLRTTRSITASAPS